MTAATSPEEQAARETRGTMRAYVHTRYGPPAVLELRDDVARPEPADDGVLVRVRATSVNPVDWYGVTGMPLAARALGGLRRPKDPTIGVDFAGVVESVGSEVEGLSPGDEVFGGRSGAFAELVCATKGVARKPANLTFEEAASIPVAAVTALQGLRDKAGLRPGQTVLVNGASGGVGTFAVQIAKALGAEVTAVCSTPNVEIASSLGADHVVDYTREDFTRSGRRYDVVLDVAGSRRFSQLKRILRPDSVVVVAGVGRPKRGLFGPLLHIVRMRLGSLVARRRCVFFVAKLERESLDALRDLIETGRVRPVVDRRYDFERLPEALAYLGEGHARGKVVVTV